jgi:hypothetical protein
LDGMGDERQRKKIIKTIDEMTPAWVAKDNACYLDFDEMEESTMNNLFSMQELERALSMIKKDSAPGIDGISYPMIATLPESAKKTLLNIYNFIWTRATIPNGWKKYQVFFIDKAGKEKVRPIALSSCVGKVMERMVNERFIWWIEKNGKLNELQNGFRRGKSCTENLAKISADIESTILKGEYALGAFLDVSAAYDNVDFEVMYGKLKLEKCPKRIANFVINWLQTRQTDRW